MNKKALMTILGAVLCGIIAVLLVDQYIKTKEKTMSQGMELVPVLTVSKDVKAGEKLAGDMLSKTKVPQKYIHGNAVNPEDMDLVIGQTLNFPLKKGDSLLFTDLGQESERLRMRSLATKVVKGERALSIAVDRISGVSGLIQPNDHVDILGTFTNATTGEQATITLLQNVTVLARGITMSGNRVEGGGGYSTVTLLVTLEEAELLIFAQEKGRLVCVLRNPEDIQTHDEIPKVTFSNIMKTEYRKQIQRARNKIEIIKRGRTSE